MLTVNANDHRVTIDRSDDQTIRFTVTDSTGAVVNVSAGSFKFTVKSSRDDAIADAKFQVTSPVGNGIDLTSAASGIVDVLIVPAHTAALAGVYYYDLEMTLSSKVRTLRNGVFFVLKDITTTGSAPTTPAVGVAYSGYVSVAGALYLYGADSLWHKFTVDASGMLSQSDQSASTPPF